MYKDFCHSESLFRHFSHLPHNYFSWTRNDFHFLCMWGSGKAGISFSLQSDLFFVTFCADFTKVFSFLNLFFKFFFLHMNRQGLHAQLLSLEVSSHWTSLNESNIRLLLCVVVRWFLPRLLLLHVVAALVIHDLLIDEFLPLLHGVLAFIDTVIVRTRCRLQWQRKKLANSIQGRNEVGLKSAQTRLLKSNFISHGLSS